MKSLRQTSTAVVLFVSVLWAVSSAGHAFGHETGRGYVVLGDSIDFGIGASASEKAWVALFHDYLEAAFFNGDADLHNLAVRGATARDIRHEQLVPAITEIQSHNPHVVSLGGGGNDLLNFITSPEAATCLRGNISCLRRLDALLNEIEHTIDLMLSMLRDAADPDTTILVRTQYNPLLKSTCGGPADPQAQLANVVLEGGAPPFLVRGLNDRLRYLAAQHGGKVVEIFLAFALNADALIANDCVHPNDLGHAVILGAAVAAAF